MNLVDIKKEFRKFILNNEEFIKSCEYIEFSVDEYEGEYDGIGVDIGVYCKLKKTDIPGLNYLSQMVFWTPDDVVYNYFYFRDGEFHTLSEKERKFLEKTDDEIESNKIETIDKVDYNDWLKVQGKIGDWLININESTSDVKSAFIELMSDMDYPYSFMNVNFIKLKDEEEIGDDDLFSNEIFLLDTDIGYISKQRTTSEYEDDSYYHYYKDGKFINAGDIYYDLDEDKVIDKEECKGKTIQYYDFTHGCTDLDSYLRNIDEAPHYLEEEYQVIEYNSYKNWEETYKKKNSDWFKKMNESKETFKKWLEGKLQKKIGKLIGKGLNGAVYELGNGNIIKLTDVKVAELYKFLNKNIEGVAKIYQIGWIYPPKRFYDKYSSGGSIEIDGTEIDITKDGDPKIGYIIMEKVDTSVSSDIEDLTHMLNKFVFSERGINRLPEDFKTWVNRYGQSNHIHGSTLSIIYQFLKKNPEKFVNFLKTTYIGILPDLLYEIIDCLNSIKKYYPEWEDVHYGQFGRNRNGELVAFDIGDDTYNIYHRKMELLPKPKNIIKEGKLKKFKEFLKG